MKKKLLFLVVMLGAYTAWAQSPQALNYQAVVRNASGTPVGNGTSVQLRFTIHDATSGGAAVYSETVTATSNQFGLVTTNIGSGGNLSTVNWGSGLKFLQVEANVAGAGFVDMGTSQLLSVPYALFSGNGTPGPTGADGAQGPAGADGADGAVGPQGPAGADGADGAVGPQGPAGADGADGAVGPQGPAGADGADGAVGPQGPAGADGADGAVGPQGPAGADGADGAVGPQGPAGADGADGAVGPQGPAGADGADGADGAAGAQGPVGPAGPQGPAGADGADGADGAAGAQGPAGPQGPAGADGADGADGAAGAQGPAGPVGPQGPAGADGADGADGAVGPAGPVGPAGADGAVGPAGPVGAAGPAGPVGAAGPAGPVGAQGPAGPTGPGTLNGTTNYVVKFTSATGGGNSLIQDNGTGVSINIAPNVLYQENVYRMQLTATGDGQSTTFGYRTRDSQNDGTAYSVGATNHGVKGYNFWGDLYTFGVGGFNYNDYTRCGGVLGAEQSGTYWGSLGYKSSASVTYGVYGSSAYGTGAGFLPSTGTNGIGGGFFGNMVGSVSRGAVVGQLNAGELFASYNIGDVYTSGRQIELVNTGNENKVAAFANTSTEAVVYKKGNAQLVNGSAYIRFEENFSALLGETPEVTVSAKGDCNGLYVTSVDKNGFTVKESKNGNSNVAISWIAAGDRVDAAKEIPGIVTDRTFDTNLLKSLYNDSNKEGAGLGMWWDGQSIRFGKTPSELLPRSKAEGGK